MCVSYLPEFPCTLGFLNYLQLIITIRGKGNLKRRQLRGGGGGGLKGHNTQHNGHMDKHFSNWKNKNTTSQAN